jgi:hypothetical protein
MEEIKNLLTKIFKNLELINLELNDKDITPYIYSEELYIEMYKIMFSFLAVELDKL